MIIKKNKLKIALIIITSIIGIAVIGTAIYFGILESSKYLISKLLK